MLAGKRGGSRYVYLVNGFITAKDATWSRGSKRKVLAGVEATVVPPLDIIGAMGLEVEAEVSLGKYIGRQSV